MSRLPVLISIPHSGMQVPPELSGCLKLSEYDIFDDIDPYSDTIYDISQHAAALIYTPIARTFVDLNRAPGDLPPANPDGIIKSKTCYGKAIYKTGKQPGKVLSALLIEKYHRPYHKKIEEALNNPEIKLALDCHTMAAVGPAFAPDTGKKRPLICLGNCYGQSCDPEVIRKLATCFKAAFKLNNSDIQLNMPFAGGYITRHYGRQKKIWIQVEINRDLYLKEPWFDKPTGMIDFSRPEKLRKLFLETLILFFDLNYSAGDALTIETDVIIN